MSRPIYGFSIATTSSAGKPPALIQGIQAYMQRITDILSTLNSTHDKEYALDRLQTLKEELHILKEQAKNNL
jgi:hypothetical protein